MKSIIFIGIFAITQMAWASEPLPQGASPELLQKISEANQAQAERDQNSAALFERTENVVPFAEYEETGYVFFNDDDYSGMAKAIKDKIAQNLPEGAKLVVYSTSSSPNYLRQLREEYEQLIDGDRLVILKVPSSGSNNFWTRDNLPLPVWTNGVLTLVDARYYYNFEPDAFITNLFQALSSQHNYFFEGGNFIANSKGDCIVVNRRRNYPGGVSDTAAIPDAIFRNQYGCQRLTRLEHLKGIGHSDEVVKFMSDDVIVTDTEEYVETLENLGYHVVMLPEATARFATYVNSLQVNDILFVPVFGDEKDNEAVAIYESLNLGLKIVTAPTRRLATRGQGGIHCITMNYPNVPMVEIVRSMNATLVH